MVESTVNLEALFATPLEKPAHTGCGSCGTGAGLASEQSCGHGLEKIYPTTAVRFGYMRYIGEFTHAPDMKFTCGARVVIQTKRGIEIGEQVSLTCGGCDKSVTRDQMKEWVRASGEDSFIFGAGRILREATAADLAENAHIKIANRAKRKLCQDMAQRSGLDIKVVECESLFGGERILFFFTAADRVDFRGIVKDLAHEYRTRIEMRQIGARDEARLLADFETCGREVCCKVFLKTLRPVSMRMAKVQKATLDPSQVSGRCGRLKCCLRYEHVAYEELDKQLPRNGVRIRTAHGEGVVVNRQIITQIVQIRTDDNKYVAVVVEDIQEVGVKAPELPPPSAYAVRSQEKRLPKDRSQRRKLSDEVGTDSGSAPDEPDADAPEPEPGAGAGADGATAAPRADAAKGPAGSEPPDGGIADGGTAGGGTAGGGTGEAREAPRSRRRGGRRRAGGRRRPKDGGGGSPAPPSA